jgi:hypothetical protein
MISFHCPQRTKSIVERQCIKSHCSINSAVWFLAAVLLISTVTRARALNYLHLNLATMPVSIQYAPCIHLHTSSERPCPKCFVDDLLRKQTHIILEDPTCSICFNDYNTPCSDKGVVETDVKLPCGHIFGSRCLMRYFSPTPNGGNGNACPTCKYELFKAWPKPKLDESERTTQLEELEEQRAISERMLKVSIRHHQMMARTARLPTIEEILDGRERRRDRKYRFGLWDRLSRQSSWGH